MPWYMWVLNTLFLELLQFISEFFTDLGIFINIRLEVLEDRRIDHPKRARCHVGYFFEI